MQSDSSAEYLSAFNGRFSGVLRWHQFQTLWSAMNIGLEGWFVYTPEAMSPPVVPLSASEMRTFLIEAEDYLRSNCMRDCCGAVYADSFTEPTFVKIYNPRLMGGCGMGKAPLPHWVLSRIQPVSLIEPAEPEGILGRLFHQGYQSS